MAAISSRIRIGGAREQGAEANESADEGFGVIELTVFWSKDKDGRKVPDVAAHFWCSVCGRNYSHSNVERVKAAAESHGLTHEARA
jgi:hypothetical protein